MNSIDISPEALERIKALAQRATPGPWITQDSSALGDDASFVTSGKRVEEGLLEIARVNGTEPAYGKRGDKFVREQRANAAFIAAAHPGVILAMCEEIERLRERVALLNKEAEWLAQRASKEKCPSSTKAINCGNADPQNCAACWRKDAEERNAKNNF